LWVAERGSWLIEADYSQIELRILAALSKDEGMLAVFRQGADLHTETARAIFRTDSPTKEQRSAAKTVNFAIVYLQTPQGLAHDIGCSVAEASGYIDGFYERFPGVWHWQEYVWKKARDLGYVTTLFGHRRTIANARLKDYEPGSRSLISEAKRQAVNTPVQGTASTICLLTLAKLGSLLQQMQLKSKIVLTVHDSILVEAPSAERTRVSRLMLTTAKSEPLIWVKDSLNGVPIEVDIKIGKRWGTMEELPTL
jgi:DNA polymerase-1